MRGKGLSATSADARSCFVARAKELVDRSGITAPPVDPLRLAALQGIRRVLLSSSLDVSGQLVRDRGELAIVLNARERVERRNFSCCHEIAHTFALDVSTPKFRDITSGPVCSPGSVEEELCDLAAAEMLMPEKFFAPIANGLEPSISSVIKLSQWFASSIRAALLRIGQLSVWPVVFIGWRFYPRLGSIPKLRVAWSVRPEGTRCFVPRHATADSRSGMYATFMSANPTLEHENLDLGSLRGKFLVENARFGDHVVSVVHNPGSRKGVR